MIIEDRKILPDRCEHLSLTTGLNLTRVNETGQAFIDLKVYCASCNEPYLFTLAMPPAPALRLAIAPASAVRAAERRIVVPSLVAKNGG